MTIESLAVPEALQKHWAFHGARLREKVKYKGHDIFLAEGGPHYDAKNRTIVKQDPGPDELIEEDKWMKDGYYVSAWALQRGKAIIGFPLYFKINHNLDLTYEGRTKARLNSAKFTAQQAIDSMISVGLLNHFEGDFLVPEKKIILPN